MKAKSSLRRASPAKASAPKLKSRGGGCNIQVLLPGLPEEATTPPGFLSVPLVLQDGEITDQWPEPPVGSFLRERSVPVAACWETISEEELGGSSEPLEDQSSQGLLGWVTTVSAITRSWLVPKPLDTTLPSPQLDLLSCASSAENASDKSSLLMTPECLMSPDTESRRLTQSSFLGEE